MNRYQRAANRIDEQVIYIMVGVCLLSLVVFSFKIATRQTCSPVQIIIRSGNLIAGNMVGFTADTKGGQTFAWNFGDGNTANESTPYTLHKYAIEGRYTISVRVNGQCTETQTVIVKPAPIIVNTSLQPMIAGNDTALVNQPFTCTDESVGATSWEWRFGETKSIDASTKTAAYTYHTAGMKKVTLRINGRADLVTEHFVFVIDRDAEKLAARRHPGENSKPAPRIIVIPAKPTAQPLTAIVQPKEDEVAKPKAPLVTHEQFEAMLMDLNEGKKSVSDFSACLCNDMSLWVSYNGTAIPFTKACEQITAIKKGTIKKITTVVNRDEQSNCIRSISITIQRKKVLGIFSRD